MDVTAVHMQKPPIVHSVGAQGVTTLQQQQQITQQASTGNPGKNFNCEIVLVIKNNLF